MDRAKYPKDWPEISRRIREERAGGRCECSGECDDTHPGGRCNAPNGVAIVRRLSRPAEYFTWEEFQEAYIPNEEDLAPKAIAVVLTVAHTCHDSACADETHLLALCQRCHLRLDRHQHGKNAAETRRRRRDERSGQLALGAKEESR
jgi:hypothetical protein